jgi:DNA-binding MarR family transcriptional regulator
VPSKHKTSNMDDGFEPSITLGMLSAVEQSSNVTQRKLAHELGIALGLANAYLKRLVKKGYIKASQAPANRYLYYLTPQGFAEKSALTGEYLSQSFKFFRDARHQCTEAFENCNAKSWRKVVLCGAGDLAEIAILSAREFDVDLVAVIDPDIDAKLFLDIPARKSFNGLTDIDAVIITETRRPQEVFERVPRRIPLHKVIVLPLLGVNTAGQSGAKDRTP